MCTTLLNYPTYNELSSITVLDRIVETQLLIHDDPLKRVLVGHKRDEHAKAQEIETCLNLASGEPQKGKVEPLECELGPQP